MRPLGEFLEWAGAARGLATVEPVVKMFGSWESADDSGPRYIVGARAEIDGVAYGHSARVMNDPPADNTALWGVVERVLRSAVTESGARLA